MYRTVSVLAIRKRCSGPRSVGSLPQLGVFVYQQGKDLSHSLITVEPLAGSAAA